MRSTFAPAIEVRVQRHQFKCRPGSIRAPSAGRLHAQSDFWAENPWHLTAFERLDQRQASVAAASTEKPSHVVL